MTETESTRLLQASLALSASLLEATNEESTLRAVMRAGCEVLGAEGCLFMPFDEFSQRLSPLEFGRVPLPGAGEFSAPAQRQRCKVCETRHAGRECALLHGDLESNFIHCVPLRARGREAGLFSFVFSSAPRLDESVAWFLSEAVRLTELALDALERGQQVRSYLSNALPESAVDVQSLPSQVEYRAILGERARLSREIHDGLAQTLAFLKIEIGRAENFLAQGKSGQAARILKDSSRTVGDAYLDAREAIENLRRVPTGRMDAWLGQVAEDFKALTNLPVEVDMHLNSEFPIESQVQMIRIVQEALTNVRKHAQASRVWLRAWEDEQEMLIEVVDDGLGFSPTDKITAARYGLRGMRERAESFGADFQVASCPNGGTTIRLRIPLRVGVKS